MDQMDQTDVMDNVISKISELINEKLEKGIQGKMDQMDEKLDKIIQAQDRSSTAKGRALSPPGHTHGYSPSPESTSCLLYNIQHAPSKVYKIEQQFFDRLEKKMSSDKKKLQEDVIGPSVVFVINSSRIQADIQRDLKSGNF